MKLRQMAGNQARGGTVTEDDGTVFTEQIRLLNQQRIIIPVNLVIAGIVAVSLWPLYPHRTLALWFELFCIVIAARSLMRSRYHRAGDDRETARRWRWLFVLGAAATGCMWGLTGSIFLMTTDTTDYIFILFVLGGIMAGGIVANAAYLPAMYAFMVPTILPAIMGLVSHRDPTEVTMGGLLALFAFTMGIAGRNINRSIVDNLRLRVDQDVLSAKLRTSEAGMAEAQAIAHVGSWEFDVASQTSLWTKEVFRIIGVDSATFRPSFDALLARVPAEDRTRVRDSLTQMVDSGTTGGIDHRIAMDDGTIKWVHESARAIYGDDGLPLQLFGILQDITDRKDTEDKLQLANVLLTTEMEASPDGILVVGPGRKIISFNRRLSEIWKIPIADLAAGNDDPVLAVVASSVRDPRGFSARVQHLYDHPDETSQDDLEMKDGRSIERHTVSLHGPAGQSLGRVWFFRDITKRRQDEALVIEIASHDGLTGLVNRRVFVEAVQHAVARAKQGGKGFAVIYLDLDHFKDVNDTLGHPIGDNLLKAVADRLRENTREADVVARFSGDEFAVVASEIDEPAYAAILAEKLIKAIGAVFSIQGNQIHSGVSIGIDVYGPEASDAETLLSHVDVALYRAKSEGRNTYRFFTELMDTEIRTRVTLGAELREAIASGQLFLMYQPQVAIEDGRITGVEALVRWRHPVRGILGPDLFIPVAETTGIVVKLGHFVLLTACRQAKAWLDAGITPIRIGVNVSASQFKTPLELENDIAAILAETGLPPHLLELELTETVLMGASHERSDIVPRLRHAGVTIAIDDFGTGYSSLEYLRRFPADRIKIAQNFVKNLETTPRDMVIVKATVGLAHELGIKAIAEGVETRGQYEMLKGWGCGEIQGFYFSAPLTAEDASPLLRKGFIPPPDAGSHP